MPIRWMIGDVFVWCSFLVLAHACVFGLAVLTRNVVGARMRCKLIFCLMTCRGESSCACQLSTAMLVRLMLGLACFG